MNKYKQETIKKLLDCITKVEPQWIEKYDYLLNPSVFKTEGNLQIEILSEFDYKLKFIDECTPRKLYKIRSEVMQFINREMYSMIFELGKIQAANIKYPLKVNDENFKKFMDIMTVISKVLNKEDSIYLQKQINVDAQDKNNMKIKIYIHYIMKEPNKVSLYIGAPRIIDSLKKVIGYE